MGNGRMDSVILRSWQEKERKGERKRKRKKERADVENGGQKKDRKLQYSGSILFYCIFLRTDGMK